MGLLAMPNTESDWTTIERYVIASTEHVAGLPSWLDEPLVVRLREIVASGVAEKGLAKRFALLEAICRDDESAMRTALPAAMEASDRETRADAFWVRTFLVTSLRLGLEKERDLAVREGVGHCPQLKADERTLIDGIVSESRKGPAGTPLVQREE